MRPHALESELFTLTPVPHSWTRIVQQVNTLTQAIYLFDTELRQVMSSALFEDKKQRGYLDDITQAFMGHPRACVEYSSSHTAA